MSRRITGRHGLPLHVERHVQNAGEAVNCHLFLIEQHLKRGDVDSALGAFEGGLQAASQSVNLRNYLRLFHSAIDDFKRSGHDGVAKELQSILNEALFR